VLFVLAGEEEEALRGEAPRKLCDVYRKNSLKKWRARPGASAIGLLANAVSLQQLRKSVNI
jgi:hypothetical protein